MKEISFEIKIPKIRLSRYWKRNIKIIFSVFIIAGAFIAKQNFDFSFIGTLILVYFCISLLWNLASRIAVSLALFFLVLTPISLVLKNNVLAETVAIYAYYFLIIAVIGEIIALKREK
jgi:hypothetical protein